MNYLRNYRYIIRSNDNNIKIVFLVFVEALIQSGHVKRKRCGSFSGERNVSEPCTGGVVLDEKGIIIILYLNSFSSDRPPSNGSQTKASILLLLRPSFTHTANITHRQPSLMLGIYFYESCLYFGRAYSTYECAIDAWRLTLIQHNIYL